MARRCLAAEIDDCRRLGVARAVDCIAEIAPAGHSANASVVLNAAAAGTTTRPGSLFRSGTARRTEPGPPRSRRGRAGPYGTARPAACRRVRPGARTTAPAGSATLLPAHGHGRHRRRPP